MKELAQPNQRGFLAYYKQPPCCKQCSKWPFSIWMGRFKWLCVPKSIYI